MMSFDIEYKFEELPSYHHDGMWSGMHNGYAEVAFDAEGDWTIRSIYLECDNRKFGEESESRFIEVHPQYEPVWGALLNALFHFHSAHIDERVAEKLEEETGPCPDANAEHRLSGRQLGAL